MIAWVAVVPLLLSAVFGLAAPAIALRLPPVLGSWLLSGGAVVAAAASSASLGLLALLVFAQTPLATAQGEWSAAVLRDGGVPAPVGTLAAVVVVVLAVRAVRVSWRRGGAVLHAYRLAAALPASGELAVLDAATHEALAVPGRPGRIVISTALLRSLDGRERRALLAHERAHLSGGHHWHQSAAALAVAVNPLLGRVPAALAQCCERWADERAAAESGRQTVADALIRAAAGALPHRAASPAVLAATAGDLAARIGALHAPPPRLARRRLALPALLLVGIALTLAVALQDVEGLFEHAQAVYRAGVR